MAVEQVAPLRILITASRDWTDGWVMFQAIGKVWTSAGAHPEQPVVIVHGACPTGGDKIADGIASALGWSVERHPADWARYGKRAGYIRNAQMTALGAHTCLAFIKAESGGASMCADLAENAGILTTRYRED